jgi:phosphate butyryltransferase
MDGTPVLYIENQTFDELSVGQSASLSHIVTQRDIELFAVATGDVNPAHMDPAYAESDMFHHIIIHGMWGAGMISNVLGTLLPGPGTIYLGQDLRFLHPVSIGDTIMVTLTVREKKPEKGDVVLDSVCTNQKGEEVITGTAYTRAPTVKVRRPRVILPDVRLSHHQVTRDLLDRAKRIMLNVAPLATAVVFPVDALSLAGVIAAAAEGLIAPVLIGPSARIRAAAAAAKLDLGGCNLIEAVDGASAAATAVALARSGDVALIMKGDLHTDDLLRPVVHSVSGLRTARRISHVFLLGVPDYPRPLLLTDAAINIVPSLAEKVDIVQNAIDLAHRLGVAQPRVAILAAVETINDKMKSTLDAAALCKMADRGQITGALLDGPLAFDNAINQAAAAEKGIVSLVAGRADILVVPDLEAGNMLAKQLTFLDGADSAGLVLGATVPIILTSRADSAAARLASCALAVVMARDATGPSAAQI